MFTLYYIHMAIYWRPQTEFLGSDEVYINMNDVSQYQQLWYNIASHWQIPQLICMWCVFQKTISCPIQAWKMHFWLDVVGIQGNVTAFLYRFHTYRPAVSYHSCNKHYKKYAVGTLGLRHAARNWSWLDTIISWVDLTVLWSDKTGCMSLSYGQTRPAPPKGRAIAQIAQWSIHHTATFPKFRHKAATSVKVWLMFHLNSLKKYPQQHVVHLYLPK